MRRWGISLWGLAITAFGCRHAAEIPYDPGALSRRASVTHPQRVAIVPLVDARAREDGSDDAEGYVYRGVEYAYTRLDALDGSPVARVTEVLARYLAATGVFRQVILVDSPEQAPDADLVLKGRMRRMRGYMEQPRSGAASTERPRGERLVLAEVFLEDLELSDVRHPDRVLLRVDAGWSIDERRLFDDTALPSAWAILGEALMKALGTFVEELERADLSGAFLLHDRVALEAPPVTPAKDIDEARRRPFGHLADAPPLGWAFARTSTAAAPQGWHVEAPRCEEVKLEARQTLRFHRTLGAYRPSVILWACPDDQTLRYDPLVEFPARYLGDRVDGTRFFVLALGVSNWPSAVADIARHLELAPPPERHIFNIEKRRTSGLDGVPTHEP